MNTIKKYAYTSILGWSVSRYDKFLSCKRQYYYDYYGKFDTACPKQKIDALKRLTSIPLEIGNIVHDMNKTLLERLLISETKIDEKRFFEHARQKTDTYCRSKTFAEVYYNQINAINSDELFNRVQSSLTNFIQSDRYIWIIKEAVQNKKDWIIEPPGYGETRINGMKAYCKVDFLFPLNDSLYIIDWKTGKQHENKHKNQLIGYSCWAHSHFNKEPVKIIPIIVYLQPVYKEMKIDVNEHDIKEFSNYVRKGTDEMYSLCNIIEENIPKDKEEFKMTDNKNICGYCNYRELCK